LGILEKQVEASRAMTLSVILRHLARVPWISKGVEHLGGKRMRTFRYLLWVGVCLVAAPCVSRGEEHQCTVGMQFADVPENFEENPGGYIAVNHVEHNRDDCRPLYIYRNCEHTFATITLSVTGTGGGGVRIWTQDRQTLLCETGGSHEWPAAEIGGPGQSPTVLWVEGTSPSTEPRDVYLHVQWYCRWDDVYLTVFQLNINVDSRNNYGFAVPTNGNDDDLIEEAGDKPGKILGVNDGDSDNNGAGDGIPGFADGFDLDPNNPDDDATGSEQFVPVLFRISDAVDLDNATLIISYAPSGPAAMSIPQPGQPYVPAGGILRLWTADASAARTKRSVTEKTPQDTVGFYVPPGTYSGANLEKLGFSGENKTVVLYAEGVRPSAMGEVHIGWCLEVHIPQYNANVDSFDAVRLTVIKVDLDVDSDNNNGLNMPDRSDLEDQYEDRADDPDHPGKFVQVNDGDKDNDGIPDFADGFGAFGPDSYETAGEEFTPLVLELPACIDPTKAKIRITYDGSGCVASTPEAGKLRIWNCYGSTPRNPNSLDYDYNGGNFIVSGAAYAATRLRFQEYPVQTVYIEGIRPSTALGDCRIVFEVDPCGTGDYMVADYVRVTTVQVNMEMDGVYHANKTSQGGFIALNDDDDDENQVEDRLQAGLGEVTGEDNLVQITLNRIEPQALSGNVTLRLSAGRGGGIWLWDNPTLTGSPIILPKNYSTPADLPQTLYVQGFTTSTGVRDYELTLEYSVGYQSFADRIRITVVDVETVQNDTRVDLDTYRVASNIQTGKPKQHFVTVQGLPGDITLLAIVSPDTEEVRKKISWTGMTQDAENRLRATAPRGAAGEYPATVNVSGRTAHQLANWVVWATTTATPSAIEEGFLPLLSGTPYGTGVRGPINFTHNISPTTMFTKSDRPDLGGPRTVVPPNVGANETGVANYGVNLATGATKLWDSSRQLRNKCINPDEIDFSARLAIVKVTTHLDYPLDETCGNDDSLPEDDEDGNPYNPGHPATMYDWDRPGMTLYHRTDPNHSNEGALGNTCEFRVHFREFVRLQLGDRWYRISDWYPWRIHLRFNKQNESESTWQKDFNGDGDTQDTLPVWRNNASFFAADNEDF